MSSADGMSYAPEAKTAEAVCKPGEFRFAAIGLDHGHIFGMCKGLRDYGGQVAWVYDPDPAKVERFRGMFPDAKAAESETQILEDAGVHLVASAAVPAERGPLGLRVQEHGKHYMSDKAPFTERSRLEAARGKVRETGLRWFVCYSERVQNEAGVYAGKLVKDGVIGRVLQVIGMGPHRLNAPSRPEWFYRKKTYGGILIDIGSHQIEQFLYYTGATDATVLASKVANYAHPEYPELEDFGDATLVADNGATNYFRVDWFTPDGLRTWGDGRTFILGTEGYMELRKYIDVAKEPEGNHIFLVTGEKEEHIPVSGKVGFPYFGQVIRDVLDGTDKAMPQEHTFKAAELCIACQEQATVVGT
jgi:predicted dehydrogenase